MYIRSLINLLICSCLSFSSTFAACPSPAYANTNSITHQSAALYWGYYLGNPPSSFQVQWRAAGATAWNTSPQVTTMSTSLTGLANSTVYEWRVRGICAAGDTSLFLNASAFQTSCLPPQYLSVYSITHKSAQLYWENPVNGATYEVQWRAAGAVNWTVVSGLTSRSLSLTGLSEDTSFEWKVRTTCSATATSDFVDGPLFRTRCLPPSNTRVTLTNPTAVELKWDSQVTNGLFDLQWRPVGGANWTLVEGISTPEYILTGLTNGATYEWQVRTACSATSKSIFTDIQVCQTSCPLPSSLNTSAVSAKSASLQWSSSISDLQWRVAGSVDWITVSGATSPYLLTGLSNNTTYEWRVRTACPSMVASDYTSTQLFTTNCPTPTYIYRYIASPEGIGLSWNAADGGVFEVQWRVTGAAAWSIVSGVTGTSYAISGLVPGTTYECRIRKVCSPSDYSDFIVAAPITIPCGGPFSLRTENMTTVKTDLVWDVDLPGKTYELQWRIANTANWTTLTNLTTNRYTLIPLQTNTAYEWRVRALCSETIASDYTPVQTFTLTCVQPTSFYTYNVEVSSAVINWVGYPTYPPYEIQYRQAGNVSWTSINNVSSQIYSLTGLSNNTAYEWRVRSYCSVNGTSDFGPTQTFQTQCSPTPQALIVYDVDPTSSMLTWQSNSNARLYEMQYRESGSTNWISLRPEGLETDMYFGRESYSYTTKKYTLYNLTPGKAYEWRVRALCTDAAYTDFVTGATFTTACSVATGIAGAQQTNSSLTVSWNQSTWSSMYDLQWRAAGTQTWNTINSITESNYVLKGLTAGSLYEYRVRKACSSGMVSDFSTTATTLMQCLNPTSAVVEVLSTTSVTLKWGYSFSVSLTPGVDMEGLIHDVQYRISGTDNWSLITGVSGTEYTLTGLQAGVGYEWQVRNVCGPGVTSSYSGTYTFVINCPQPYLNSLQLGSTSARFAWYNSSTIKTYQLQWRPAGATQWTSVSLPGLGASYLNASVVYSLTGLTNNTLYEWRVAGSCGDTYQSDFSSVQTFQTTCPSIQNVSTNRVGNTSAEVSWSGTELSSDVVCTVQYRIKGQVVWTELSGVTTTTVVITGLLNNTYYEWRVRTQCGTDTKVSMTSTFQTQCAAPINPYVYAITRESAVITWGRNADNASVTLQWRRTGANSEWTTVNGLAGSNYPLTGLRPQTAYEYRLQSVCSVESPGGTSAWWSSSFNTLYTNFNVSADSVWADGARLNWAGGPDQTNYILQWRVRDGAWSTSGPLATKRYLLTGLQPNTAYEVKLGYAGANGTAYETSTSFATYCPRLTYLYAADVTATTARLVWSATSVPVSVQWRVGGTTSWSSVMGILGNSYTLTGLTNNTTYEYRISTQCTSTSTDPSYVMAFRTLCRMPIWTITDNVTSESAQLRWSDLGSQYSVQYRVVGTTNWTVLTGLTSATYVLTGLTDNTTYEWAVATTCEGNTTTAYTSPIRFKVQCTSAQVFAINTNLGLDLAQITWSGSGPTYQFRWRAVGTQTWNEVPEVTSPYTLTGLTPGVTYEFGVRAPCVAAADGPFTSGTLATLNCYYYTMNQNTANITTKSAKLVWSGNVMAIYGLRWRAVGSSTWNEVTGNLTAPYTLTGLTNNTLYEWQVYAPCQLNYNTLTVFQTQCSSPVGMRTEELTTTSARLRWNNTGDETGYVVRWRVAGATAWSVLSGITDSSYSLTGLASNTAYEWQVRTLCGDDGNFQFTELFSTINDCPSGMYTVRTGSWNDPTVWSCNRVPTPTDQVQVNHVVTIPAGYAAKAAIVRYATGAQLAFGMGATVQFGN